MWFRVSGSAPTRRRWRRTRWRRCARSTALRYLAWRRSWRRADSVFFKAPPLKQAAHCRRFTHSIGHSPAAWADFTQTWRLGASQAGTRKAPVRVIGFRLNPKASSQHSLRSRAFAAAPYAERWWAERARRGAAGGAAQAARRERGGAAAAGAAALRTSSSAACLLCCALHVCRMAATALRCALRTSPCVRPFHPLFCCARRSRCAPLLPRAAWVVGRPGR